MNRVLVAFCAASLLYFGIWFWIFNSVVLVNDRNTGQETDKLSNQSFNKTAVNSDRGPNPNSPYFVGFNLLSKYGLPASDLRYIRDAIANDTLYRQKLVYAKVSYVDGTFVTPKNEGLASSYSFKYGTNDSNIQTLEATSDIGKNTIEVTIKDNTGAEVFEKKFDVFYN